jgi:DNA-directed RNA polymerase subunit RPC12/RpoP
MDKDVTNLTSFGCNDENLLPMFKCVCGKEFDGWDDFVISTDEDDCDECPHCNRKFYFKSTITIYEKE